MFRNFNSDCLGIAGRQSELIEVALSYKFGGMDIDMAAFAKQAGSRGFEHAFRYLESAGLRVGTFELPVRLCGEDAAFNEGLAALKEVAESAKKINATRCVAGVQPGSDDFPFQENFERHQTRLKAIAEILEPHDIRLGLEFQAAEHLRKDLAFEFISTPEKLISLVDVIGSPSIGLTLDLWNWHVAGATVDDVKKLSADKVVAVKIADVPAGSVAELESNQRLMPGSSGVAPAKEFLAALQEIGFDGPVTAYPHSSQVKRGSRDVMSRQLLESLKSVWGAAPLPEDIDESAEAEVEAAKPTTADKGPTEAAKPEAAATGS